MIRFEEALELLLPNVEWICYGGDLKGLTILDKSIQKPTEKEINDALEQIKITRQQAKIDSATKKAEILERLGITADEAAILLL